MAEQEVDYEEWRDIPDFDGYQASSLGRIRSLSRTIWNTRGFFYVKRERILKRPKPDKNGYLSHTLRDGASRAEPRKKTFLLHRLVALAFIANPENKPFVNHKNGDKGECRSENLEWCTKSENGIHAVLTGLHTALRGESNGHSILTEIQVRELRTKYSTGAYTSKALAAQYGVARSTIHAVLQGKNWAHVEIEAQSNEQRQKFIDTHAALKSQALSRSLQGRAGKKGDTHPLAKLNNESVLSIRNKFRPTVYTVAMLATEYGVTRSTIKAILSRRLWGHI